MSITSLSFFAFVTVVVIAYYITPLKCRQWIPLIASLPFYIWGCGIPLTVVMCIMSVFAWSIACVIGGSLNKHHKIITRLAVTILIVTLISYRELSFFTINANILGRILGLSINLTPPNWVAPLGISYYTLMLVSYILDVSWGKIPPEKNPLRVLLFTCYFPQMALGPLTRYGDISKYHMVGHRFDYDNVMFGLQRIAFGLFKKLVIAERLAVIVSNCYGNYETLGGLYTFLGAICYVGQVYMDFSAAIDIVIGVSQLIGIKLPENFSQPFYSRSISEIWRRWHITLGLWVKDYIMYPVQKGLTTKFGKSWRDRIGKNASKNIILYLSMFITWFYVGFWHGGAWNYISVGMWCFLIICGGMLLQPLFNKLIQLSHINTESKLWQLFQRLRTFCLFMFAVSFQPAASLTDGFHFWRSGFSHLFDSMKIILFGSTGSGRLEAIGVGGYDILVIIFGLFVVFCTSAVQLRHGSAREFIAKQNIVIRWSVWLVVIISTIFFGWYGATYTAAEFIYAGF